MIRKVLLPVDTCRDFQDCIRYGMEIAASMRAELCLLHVARSSRRSDQPRWSAECDFDDDTRRLISQAVVRRGSLAETIASYARSIDADLILMPARGRGLLGRLLFGSTTMDLLRTANRPLWVAKPQSITAEKPVRCKRILCGVELGAQGESVLRYAAGLAGACGGELMIVHAVPEISEAMLMAYGLGDSEEIELLPGAAQKRVTSMAATVDVPYQVEARIGDAAAVLQKFAKRWRADVVVVGRGRRTDRCQLGANIGDIIARSPSPVITCPGSWRHIQPRSRSARLGTAAASRPALSQISAP